MSRDPYLPLFLYGTLREGHPGAELLASSVERRKPAIARGLPRSDGSHYPKVSFRSDEGDDIQGEVVWLRRSSYAELLARIDDYEAPLFQRVRVTARVGGEQVEAFAYEWSDPSEYLEAARRKIAIASYHAEAMGHELARTNEASITVQAHFEGVLYAIIAATDQLAEALNTGLDLELIQPSLQEAVEQIAPGKLRAKLLKWQQAAIMADVRDIRRRATHHYYRKTPLRPELTVQVPTRARPYGGRRSLDTYVAAATEHATHLSPLIDEIEGAITEGRDGID